MRYLLVEPVPVPRPFIVGNQSRGLAGGVRRDEVGFQVRVWECILSE